MKQCAGAQSTLSAIIFLHAKKIFIDINCAIEGLFLYEA
jgi:hypothetical protein